MPPFCVIVRSDGLLEYSPGVRVPHGVADHLFFLVGGSRLEFLRREEKAGLKVF